MIKTFATALACVASIVSIAQAQPQAPAPAGASVGGRTGITGGSSVVTPPASTGTGVSGGASGPTSQPAQPSIDINRAQQPGIGTNSGPGVGRQDPAQMGLAEDNNVIEAFPADRADQSLRMPVLPG